MNKKTILLLAAAGLGVWWITRPGRPSRWGQLQYLYKWADEYSPDPEAEALSVTFVQMTDQELLDTYTFIHDYFERGNKPVPEGSALQLRLTALSNKYNIFT